MGGTYCLGAGVMSGAARVDDAAVSLQRVLDQVRAEVRLPGGGGTEVDPADGQPITLSVGAAERRVGDDHDQLLSC